MPIGSLNMFLSAVVSATLAANVLAGCADHSVSASSPFPVLSAAATRSPDQTPAETIVPGAEEEAPLLNGHLQLTHRGRFLKAGEAYFDHQSPPGWMIFQAIPVPEAGQDPLPFYSMYIAKLIYKGQGAAAKLVGIEEPIEISPGGSANTCGWFHPTQRGVVIYGSTLEAPKESGTPGYQRGTSKYRWAFAPEMRIVSQLPLPLARLRDQEKEAGGGHAGAADSNDQPQDGPLLCGNSLMPRAIVGDGAGYVAEGSISPDGRTLLFARMVDAESKDLDLYVMDLESGVEHRVVQAPGYDGGPFFSPDGKSICYRSDRRGTDELQIYVARLTFDAEGRPNGSRDERALTDNAHVNWAPYWHPSGKFLVYGTSAMGHTNYEVFAVEVDWDKPQTSLRQRRVTRAKGADVLPVFSDDGRWMMWTGQRGPTVEGESRPSSQVWVASVNVEVAGDLEKLFASSPGAAANPAAAATSQSAAHKEGAGTDVSR